MFALQATASCKGPGFAHCCPEVAAASPEVFGPPLWFSLHTMAATYPEAPSATRRAACERLLGALPEMLPCEHCGEHFAAFVRAADVPAACGGREALAQLMCAAHNEVNRRNGKEVFPCEQVLARYASSAVCPPEGDVEHMVSSLRAQMTEGLSKAGAAGVCSSPTCSSTEP